jgi:hypothetical protein
MAYQGGSAVSEREKTASMMKIEQIELFKNALKIPYREASALFDQFKIWDFIDDAYEGLRVQGAGATFEDIRQYLQQMNYKIAV